MNVGLNSNTRVGVAALVVGVAVGWIARSVLTTESTHPIEVRDGLGVRPIYPIESSSEEGSQVALSGALSELVVELDDWGRQIEGLSSDEYAELLAEYLGGAQTAENLARTALLLKSLDAGKAVATYVAFKKRHGLGPYDNDGRVRPMLLLIGEQQGKLAVEGLLAEYPNGFQEIGSITHGWGLGNATECLDWINELDAGNPAYEHALKGLFWSVGVRGPEYAADSIALLEIDEMDPRELDLAGTSMAGAMLQNHGAAGFDEWMGSLPDSIKSKAVQWALWRDDWRPIGEVVPWLGRHARSWESLNSHLQSKARAWARSDPDAAIQWSIENFLERGGDSASGDILNAVTGEGGEDVIARWLEQNESNPSAESVREAVRR